MEKPLKIAYVANVRMPTEKAHGYQIGRVCTELSQQGVDVTLYVPFRDNDITENTFEYYGLEENFSVSVIKSVNVMRLVAYLGPIASLLHGLFFTLKLIFSKKISRDCIVYSRDAEILWIFGLFNYKTAYNAHKWTERPRLRTFFLKRVLGIVCNSAGTKKILENNIEKPCVAIDNGADENKYIHIEKLILRNELGLRQDSIISLYAGHLYKWKGSETLFSAAKDLPHSHQIIVIGGLNDDVQRYRERTRKEGLEDKILYMGHVQKEKVPKFLRLADILLLPNTAENKESVEQTSPLKLFEYMASGTPIIASDLPSIKNYLNDEVAYFFEPGNAIALVEQIKLVADQIETKKVKTAIELSQHYTWSVHASKLVDFLRSMKPE